MFCPENVSRSLFFPSTAEDTTHEDTIVNSTLNKEKKKQTNKNSRLKALYRISYALEKKGEI
jgi:hypothetical protein